mgnify:CR=1 FL=1
MKKVLKGMPFFSALGLKNRWCFKKYADYILTTIEIS